MEIGQRNPPEYLEANAPAGDPVAPSIYKDLRALHVCRIVGGNEPHRLGDVIGFGHRPLVQCGMRKIPP